MRLQATNFPFGASVEYAASLHHRPAQDVDFVALNKGRDLELLRER